MKMGKRIRELSLLLMYLTGWKQSTLKNPNRVVYCAWNGFLPEILNDLEDEGLIKNFKTKRSVIITKKGIEKAKALKAWLLNIKS